MKTRTTQFILTYHEGAQFELRGTIHCQGRDLFLFRGMAEEALLPFRLTDMRSVMEVAADNSEIDITPCLRKWSEAKPVPIRWEFRDEGDEVVMDCAHLLRPKSPPPARTAQSPSEPSPLRPMARPLVHVLRKQEPTRLTA